MRRKLFARSFGLTAAFLFAFSAAGYAQEDDSDPGIDDSPTPIGEYLGFDKARIREALQNPETLNKALDDQINPDSPLGKFLGHGNIRFNTFDVPDGDSSIGITWNFDRSLVSWSSDDDWDRATRGLDLSVSSRGNFAFDSDANPTDFIQSKFSFAYSLNRGGVVKPLSDDDLDRIDDLIDELAEIESPEELARSEANKNLLQELRSAMKTQFYTELAVDVGFESDQQFDNEQYAFGGHFGLDIKEWNPDRPLAKFNFLDYPFAATRLLLGNDSEWRPTGAALPTLILGIDLVTPTDATAGTRVGDDSDYVRLKAETGYRSLVGDAFGGPMFFEVNARYYRELSPSTAVKSAGLDEHLLFSASLLLPKGIYLSYSTGDLPFDLEDERVIALGFNHNF